MSTAVRREGASGTGLATTTADGTVLDTWYPAPALGPDAPDTAADLDPLAGPDDARGVTTAVVRTAVASLADPPVDAPDAYLRLHLLSHRLVAPHEDSIHVHQPGADRETVGHRRRVERVRPPIAMTS